MQGILSEINCVNSASRIADSFGKFSGIMSVMALITQRPGVQLLAFVVIRMLLNAGIGIFGVHEHISRKGCVMLLCGTMAMLS